MSTMMGSGLSVKVYGDDLDTLTKITQDICDLAATIPGYEIFPTGRKSRIRSSVWCWIKMPPCAKG